ncbi:26S proteasome non-ATPase regulatory subunit 5 [Sarcoptes scabiei]|uniref:26S proteasome non-ATPase regulatory subunit 5 n=1 Tax=Sarcoptes scabiei TaxID=52283 RepID=A0A834VED4_SARSC|nr:26S proteasome non-ATPase regulatory subunit 5 [Sarcoptes scabiei]UXI21376.1 Ribonuclease 3 [Sarcoptes scabiei]
MDEKNDQKENIKKRFFENLERLDHSKSENDLKDCLENLKALCIAADPRVLQHIANELDLSQIFDRFNSQKDQAEIFTPILKLFLEALPMGEIFKRYHRNILDGLRTTNDTIIELWIKTLVKPVFINDGLIQSIGLEPELIAKILKTILPLLANQELSISTSVHDICVAASGAFRSIFFSPDFLKEFRRAKNPHPKSMSRSEQDQLAIRYYQLCVDIANKNQLLMDRMQENRFLEEIVKDFQDKLDYDPLIAFNLVKIVIDLASTQPGLQYLRTSTSLLPFVANKIQTIDPDTFESSLLTSLINFFIRIGRSDLKILEEYPLIMEKLIGYCQQREKGDRELQLLAIESIAYLCTLSEGKIFSDNKIDSVFDVISMMIDCGKSEYKCRSIMALNDIMEIQGSDPGGRATQITEGWYKKLEKLNCGLDRFMEIVKEPFLDVRLPAIRFLRILASTLWGQKILVQESGFIDYLFDTDTENNLRGHQAKHSIVTELVMSPFTKVTFPSQIYLRLKNFYKNGSLIPSNPNVLFENS